MALSNTFLIVRFCLPYSKAAACCLFNWMLMYLRSATCEQFNISGIRHSLLPFKAETIIPLSTLYQPLWLYYHCSLCSVLVSIVCLYIITTCNRITYYVSVNIWIYGHSELRYYLESHYKSVKLLSWFKERTKIQYWSQNYQIRKPTTYFKYIGTRDLSWTQELMVTQKWNMLPTDLYKSVVLPKSSYIAK